MNTEEFNDLICRIAQKDKTALESIYYKHGKSIKWIGYHVTGDWHHAEDVLNEVLVKLWENAPKLSYIASPNAWLYKFSKFTAIDYYRSVMKKYKDVSFIDDIPKLRLVSNENNNCFDICDELRCLDKLSREIIILKIQFEFTFKEISQLLKKPMGTITWKYKSAIDRLKLNEIKKVKKP